MEFDFVNWDKFLSSKFFLIFFVVWVGCLSATALPYQINLNYCCPAYYQKTLMVDNLSDDTTIGEIKSLVYRTTKIPTAKMTVFLQGDFMNDAQSVEETAQHGERVIDIWIDEGGLLCTMW